MRVVVCGAGAIGAAIAWALSRRGVAPVIVERTGVAAAASGKSGGFLALDWCDGTKLAALARRSFALHAAWPAEVGADWGYRRLDTYGGFAGPRGGAPGAGGGPLGWLAGAVRGRHRLGSPETTAQIDPAAFTAGLVAAAEARGAVLRPGRVTGLLRRGERVTGVTLEDGTIEADAVVLALGPWMREAARWLDLPAVYGLKGHSVVLEVALPPEAAFLEYQDGAGEAQAPELFARPDGTLWACAISSESPLPDDPAAVAPDPGAIPRLRRICAALSPALAAAPVRAAQACFRPVTRDGLPLIGAVAGAPGAIVATGHSVWGMLNAPATGEAIAELLLDGAARTVDLAPFDPGRLPPA